MKIARHAQILSLIKEYDISTQSELVDYLRRSGYDATQATVSRDIRALKLTKAAGENGNVRYVAPESDAHPEKYLRVLRDSVTEIILSTGLIVIKTVPGMAMASAASLDEWNNEKVAGCIAGDDTIFCALKTNVDPAKVKKELEDLLV